MNENIKKVIDEYENQAGTGIAGFQGYKHQRGHGFGSFLKNMWKNIVPYFKPKLISTAVKIGEDYNKGENFKSSLSKRLRETGGDMLNDAASRARKFIQTGKGRRRKYRKKKRKLKKILKKQRQRKKTVKNKKRKRKHQFSHLI